LEAGRVAANRTSTGERHSADHYVSALSFEKLRPLVPSLPIEWDAFTHSPITGVHLWFDRPVTTLPHGTLLDRTIQWFFNKSEGRYLQLVISASRSLSDMPRQEVIDLCLRELAEFLPAVREARLEKAHVVKEIRATFSAAPSLEARRPEPATIIPNLFLAGDWTRSGWPATMEGAVRSGYRAAEAVAQSPGRFLLPDIA
ncbi:MAG: FAD-dependent oxidoreductase, partial [Bryobacteraceae bacterium]|nr:FAD-dependent oxidoreductase [Bryobacteraceae bacterium]